MDEANDPLVERAQAASRSHAEGQVAARRAHRCRWHGGGVLGHPPNNGKRVAVKMLHAELSVGAARSRTRFLARGATPPTRSSTPARSRCIDDETDEDGAVFLVMELLDGETLAHRFERKARSLVIEEVLLIADQVLDVLAAAHDKGIVHRDIKPDNIFLTRSRRREAPRLRHRAASRAVRPTSATRSGSTMGTPAYMAPEQARARWDEVDARTDLWAVGATMFKLLTGRVVHVGRDDQRAAPRGDDAACAAHRNARADRAHSGRRGGGQGARVQQGRPLGQRAQACSGRFAKLTRRSPASPGRFGTALVRRRRWSGLGHADTIAASSKVPTSLTAAHDSASFGTRRPRSRSKIGLARDARVRSARAGYWFLSQRKSPASCRRRSSSRPGRRRARSTGTLEHPPSALCASSEQALPHAPAVAESAASPRSHRKVPHRHPTPPAAAVRIRERVPAESADAPGHRGPPGAATRPAESRPCNRAAQRPRRHRRDGARRATPQPRRHNPHAETPPARKPPPAKKKRTHASSVAALRRATDRGSLDRAGTNQ